MPIAWVSMMELNSLRSGSGASAATTLIDSNSGRPALMPRTMTSTASGSAARNAFSRFFFRKASSQRGRPKPKARFCMFMARLSGRRLYFGRIEGRGQPLLLVVVPRTFPELRATDAGRAVLADDLAVGVFADHVVEEDVLGDDGVAFHAHHLGNVGDAAGTVAKAGGLH